jgi:hypothetical protein
MVTLAAMTGTATKTKPAAKPILKRVQTRVLSAFPTVQMQVAAFPQLGPPKFSLSQQNENPEAQMTRVVKDVLRVGRWKIGHDEKGTPVFWSVTHETLDEIAENFTAQLANGVEHPLSWGHVQRGKSDIDSRDTIAQISDVFHKDGTLYVAAYVSLTQATVLQNSKRQVSIGATTDLTDGEGRTYPGESLVHVAIVEHPVVPGQGGFIQLSLSSEVQRKAINHPSGVKQMAFTLENWVKAVNSFLPDGSDIPTEGEGAISEENADEVLAMVMSLMGKKPAEEGAGDDAGGDGGGDSGEVIAEAGAVPALEEMPVEMQNKIKKDPVMLGLFNHFNAKVSSQQKELALLKATERKAKSDAFDARLNEMGKAGLDAVTILELKDLGKKNGYELSLLKPYEKLCDKNLMQSHAKQLGSAEPNNPSVKKTKSPEEIKRLASSL